MPDSSDVIPKYLLSALAALLSLAAWAEDPVYRIHYGAEFLPDRGVAAVRIRVEQDRGELRHLTITAPRDRYRAFAGPGVEAGADDEVVWDVPRKGGVLRFEHVVDHRRPGGGFDARMTNDWALLKADRLFPRMRARTVKGAHAAASIELAGPPGWLFQTRYGRVRGSLSFEDPERRFDRPTGWMVLGRIAARREDIAERYVLIASPAGQGYRHNDVMAFLTWNLPVIVELLPQFPARLLIVGASGEMWRGGLSGTASLYLHADRPFISQNGTSPMLHELIHVGSRLSGKAGGDWIVEGLAEYYGLETLRRSGTISETRYQRAFAHLRDWAESANGCLARDGSTGPDTARAVLVLDALDGELRSRTRRRASLDVVLRRLVSEGPKVDEGKLRRIVEDLLDGESAILKSLPRCRES